MKFDEMTIRSAIRRIKRLQKKHNLKRVCVFDTSCGLPYDYGRIPQGYCRELASTVDELLEDMRKIDPDLYFVMINEEGFRDPVISVEHRTDSTNWEPVLLLCIDESAGHGPEDFEDEEPAPDSQTNGI
jgi:hypothetical protein